MSTNGESKAGPAYAAYPSFKTLLEHLKEHGIPGQVDRSVMSSFSGGTQSHLAASLRFLRLVGQNFEPTRELRTLVEAVGTSEWSDTFRPIVETAYKDVLGELDLAAASPRQLEDKLREAGLDGSTIEKAFRFLLQAAKEAKIPYSSHLGRRKTGGPRRTSRSRTVSPPETVEPVDDDSEALDGKPVADMISFPLHIRNKSPGKIIVPKDITPEECKLLKLALDYIGAYAAQNAVD